MSDPVLVADDGRIATVTLNRPEKYNALSMESESELTRIFNELSEREDVRCIVIRGAGDKAFASGADISGFETQRSTVEQVRKYAANSDAALEAVAACRHPVIAMIHGYCLGGGFELVTACDMRIADPTAKFGVPVKNIGLYLGYTLLDHLIMAVGYANAMEIVLEGRTYDAEEAERRGFVNRVVPESDLESHVYETAARIADGAPLSARWHKKAIRRMYRDPSPPTAAEIEDSYSYAETADYHSAYRAFLEKRKPEFEGR